ncbi:MAG: DUF4153 domain-containing protein [Dysgonamonadaceae bacterium]|jgi:hypothetical protein|nr:DUF4153 domain-containing protein [Dysgonamonadaceae bacterium]
MKLLSLALVNKKLQLLIRRFPVVLLMIAGIAGLMFVEINDIGPIIPYPWWVFFIVGTFISLVATLGTENQKNWLWKYGIILGSVLLLGVYCFFLPPEDHLHFDHFLQIGLGGIAFIPAIFFISFLKKNRDTAFWAFSIKTIFYGCLAFLFGIFLFAGLCLAVYSIDSLFDVNVEEEFYGNLLIICFILFSPVYFLANIPGKTAKYDEDISFPKALKILGLYILSPILGLYILILYAYLARIIAAWELPDGWVSVLVSTLASSGLLLILILYPLYWKKENKVAVFLSRYFGLLLLPLLALMTIGIFRRIGDYGLTINRGYLVLLNAWFYAIFIYLSVTRSKHIKWIVISPAVILFLASVGPCRVSRITQRALMHRLEVCFAQAGLLENGKLPPAGSSDFFLNADNETKERVAETLKYLVDTYGVEAVQPFFAEDVGVRSRFDLMAGLNLSPVKPSDDSFYITMDDIYFQPIAGYTSFVEIDLSPRHKKTAPALLKNDSLYFENERDRRSFVLPLKEQTLRLIDAQETTQGYLPFAPDSQTGLVRGKDCLLLIKSIGGKRSAANGDSLTVHSLSGYLFYN